MSPFWLPETAITTQEITSRVKSVSIIYGSVGQFKHFLWFSFISGTFGNKRKASRTASSKEHECVTDILFQTNMPEQRVINQPIGTQGSYSERGKSQNNGLATGPFFFSSPRLALRAKYRVRLAWLIKRLFCRLLWRGHSCSHSRHGYYDYCCSWF